MSNNNTNTTHPSHTNHLPNQQPPAEFSKESNTFETIYEQNKNRIHYQLYRLGIQDPHNEFFTEGIYAMWRAYKKHQPNKGPMGTYFNYQIRYRLIDKLRRKTTTLNKADQANQTLASDIDNGNHYNTHKFPLIQHTDISPQDNTFWNYIRSRLTPNQ